MIFDPLDFISKLAALVPSPWVNLIRFHGVFAPNSQYRAAIIKKANTTLSKAETKTESEKRRAMTWALRLKRAFNIDIKIGEMCGGAVKVIACMTPQYKILIKISWSPTARRVKSKGFSDEVGLFVA